MKRNISVKRLCLLGMMLFSFIATACSQAKFSVANAPSITFNGEIVKDIPYGDLDRQRLDIYKPANLAERGSAPVIVFFHGGRWTDGNKDQYKFVGMALANKGYITVVPNTRLYPQVKFPAFVEDAAKAIAWTADNIDWYKGRKQNIFLSGHSSGAHIAALAVTDERYLQAYGKTPSVISAFAGLSGPYDFTPEAADLKDMFGPPSNYPNMQISTFANGNEPPMLFIHGGEDETVKIENLKKAKQAILNANGRVETQIYPDANHIDPVAALSWINPGNLPIATRMDQFFKKYMK